VKKTQSTICLAILLCASLATTKVAWAQTFQMRRTISPEVTKLPTFGDVPPTLTLPLQVWLKPRDQAGLDSLLSEQQNPKSPHYHQRLTPQEYTTRFGPSQAEFNRISKWLADQGFQVTGGSPAVVSSESGAASLRSASRSTPYPETIDGRSQIREPP
jgi:subtilase family serine protease